MTDTNAIISAMADEIERVRDIKASDLRCEVCNSADWTAVSPGDEANGIPSRVWCMACWKGGHHLKSGGIKKWIMDLIGKAIACH
jgi:hypothetical protein